jgi:hypothetical protein
MTSQSRTCPTCQAPVPADAPGGACPACALCAGLDLAPTIDSPTFVATSEGPQQLSAEILAARLPELEGFALIGRGGMGAVYGAMHRNLQRPVAVKVLDATLSEQPAFAQRFAREARTLAQLDHPNVVRVYDSGERDGMYYLVMELVDGVSLRQTLQAGGLEPEEALALVPKVCAALQYAHDQGVVHRDIKPENILIDRGGAVKIADFGLAKLVDDEADLRLTRPRQVMGTPNYMAPEQIEHPETVDHRADIFALGVVFYELLTGELPVGRFPLPSERAQIDTRLDGVVLRTLEKEPQRRYQAAEDVRSDVVTLAGGGDLPPAASLRPAAAAGASSGAAPRSASGGIDYRSRRRIFGLPLVHICFGRDPEGKRLGRASGIIAIGDIAIGAVAIGGFSFGGVSVGGMGLGLIGIGGLVPGLLAGMGGIAAGALALGGLAFGGFGIGVLAIAGAGVGGDSSQFNTVLSEALQNRLVLATWLTLTGGVVVAAWAAIHAWLDYVRAEAEGVAGE